MHIDLGTILAAALPTVTVIISHCHIVTTITTEPAKRRPAVRK